MIFFFYQRALQEQQNDKDQVGEEDYRYPGPLPRSKEASIISLADACEAASRSLEKPSPQKIDGLVADIFANKIQDGQLDDSELTMEEIKRIETSIKKSLRTIFHSRVKYPTPQEV